jgi:tRNA (guanine37-N1)-methyltransferase
MLRAVKFSVLTLFPQLILPWTREAIIARAVERGLLEFDVRDIRDATTDRHRTVDDTPYGGGAGMVMRVDVVARALEGVNADEVVMLTPAGERFTQSVALELSSQHHIALLCGRYEGFDARVESLVTRELSVGDFVMMGGEAAAVCVIEAVARLIPGVLNDEDSHRADSFSSGLSSGTGRSGLLDYPEFTRPPVWNALEVPDILKGGNHAAIARWRRREALRRTLERRPDVLPDAGLGVEDLRDLLEWGVRPETIQAWGFELPPPPKLKRKRRSSA